MKLDGVINVKGPAVLDRAPSVAGAVPPMVPAISIHTILIAACDHFNVSQLELVSDRRVKGIVGPRHVAMWLCRELTTASYPLIGKMIGRRDHTTVLYACRKIDSYVLREFPLGLHAVAVREKIKASAQ